MSTEIRVNEKELQYRIEKNFQRLTEPYYQIQEVFSDPEYDWPGDKEGRALLAFVCQARMTGKKIPCMDELVAKLPEKTNHYGFFGPEAEEIIHEQQLSGHNWYLRGLLEYYNLYGNEEVLNFAKSTFEHLYMPTKGRYASYPIERSKESEGGVSGCLGETKDGWLLSTDIGCAFMSIDGLSQFYEVTKDERALALLDEMHDVFMQIDKEKIEAQTHCTLTAARGFLRIYGVNGDEKYLNSAIAILDLYCKSGMTYTYQNFNWWGKGDTWTEPCAIVDSIMVAGKLYEITKKEEYRVLAARIWHNGFSSAQNPEGGAGPDTTISDTQSWLYVSMYEAPFCCTMRFAEGLLFVKEHKELLTAVEGKLQKDEHGRYMAGDIIYAEAEDFERYEKYMEKVVEMDGHKLCPLIKNVYMTVDEYKELKQRVRF